MEDINKSFNIKSLQAFAEQTANFAEQEPDLEANRSGNARDSQSKQGGIFSPVVKTVILVLAAVFIVLILVYFIYQKLKRNKPATPEEGIPQGDTPQPSQKTPQAAQTTPSTKELLAKLSQLQSVKEADNESSSKQSEAILQDDTSEESEGESCDSQKDNEEDKEEDDEEATDHSSSSEEEDKPLNPGNISQDSIVID